MAHLNLFVKVGRAERQCIGTFEHDEKAVADAYADHAQADELASLKRSGVASDRVQFTRDYVGFIKKSKGNK